MAISRYLGFAKETTFGTPVAGSVFCDPESMEMDPTGENLITYKGISGQDNLIAQGNYMTEGSFTVPFDNKVMMYLAKYALCKGSDGYTTSGTGTITHVIKPSTDPLMEAITFRLGKDKIEQYFTGCAIDKMSINIKPGEFAKCQFDIVGAQDASASLNTSYSYTTGTIYSASDVSINLGEITGHTRIEEVKLNLAFNTDGESGIVIGSRFPKRVFRGALDISGEMSLAFDDTTELRRFWGNISAGTAGPLTTISEFPLTYVLGTNSIALPRTVYTNISQPVSGRDRIVQNVKFRALRSADGATAPITFTFVNNIAAIS